MVVVIAAFLLGCVVTHVFWYVAMRRAKVWHYVAERVGAPVRHVVNLCR